MSIIAPEYYGDGKFEFIESNNTRELYKNAHWAITQCELWDWLGVFEVERNNGFTYSEAPQLERIRNKMMEQDAGKWHSGISYGVTMRAMDYIAKYGYNNFRNDVYTNVVKA